MGNPHSAPLGEIKAAIAALNDLSIADIINRRRILVFNWDAVSGSFVTCAGNDWVKTPSDAHFLGQYLTNSNTPSLNDAIGIGSTYCSLIAEGYNFYAIGSVGGDRGIMQVKINGSDKGTIDWYSVGEGDNIIKWLDLGELTTNISSIKIVMSSKNASSTGYLCKLQSVIIYPYAVD